jgi:integrase
MRKHHAQNERIKRQYFAYLEEAKRMSKSSVDQVAAAIAQFETSTGYRDFRAFHIEQARKFKRQLAEAINPATGKPLAKATIYSRLMALKAFFTWLAGQPGYKSRLTYSDTDYFNPSNNDGRIAKAVRKRPAPTLEQVRHVLARMPRETDIEKRDRALVAFALVSGARDDAIASMSLRHVNLTHRTVFQDAREVRTKNRKTFTSNFFPVGAEIEAIVTDWILYLTRKKLFGSDDPLFPATCVAVGKSGQFEPAGLARRHWRDAGAIRRIFRRSFETAGLPYSNPHLCRDTLTLLGEQRCPTPEAFKAWSQNLGHEHVLTTLTSYGAVSAARQAEILNSMQGDGAGAGAEPDPETVRQVVAHLMKKAS